MIQIKNNTSIDKMVKEFYFERPYFAGGNILASRHLNRDTFVYVDDNGCVKYNNPKPDKLGWNFDLIIDLFVELAEAGLIKKGGAK